ncbi:MAG: Holliday junction resolvase RuvX [Planctomycetota bacterium]
MSAILAIDYGTKRLGLAVADHSTRIPIPLKPLAASGQAGKDVAAVLAAADQYTVTEFVVGLPLNMDGSEGTQARLTRNFGEALRAAANRPVHYSDERLSSATAQELLAPAELSRGKSKARLDSVAAVVILQTFLEQNAG